MSPKKKKRSSKKKAISAKGRSVSAGKKKLATEKLQRKILPFTAGVLPSVSRSMPQAASAIRSVSKEILSISKSLPQVSAKPNISIPKYWGIMPNKKWGKSEVPATRRQGPGRPKDIGVFNFLGKVITAPYQPVEMIKAITAAVGAQAEEERDPKAALEQALIELKMQYEMGKVSEDDYKILETKLKRRIKNLEEKETKKKARKVKEKPKRKKRKKRTN